MFSFREKLFGKEIEIVLLGVDENISEIVCHEAYNKALELQKIFNIYDKKSEITELNNKRKLNCSDSLIEVINYAIKWCKKTDGRYDISLGKLFKSRKSKDVEIKPDCSYKDIEITGNIVTLNHKDILIDLGSVAKGFIVDKVVEFIQNYGVENGFVNGRGDIRFFGDENHIIGIQHPRDKKQIISNIKVKDEAVATSGDYNQFRDNFQSHIINSNNYSSVTVVAKTLKEADILSTIISIMNDSEVEKFMKNEKDLKVITFNKNIDKKTYNIKEE